MSACKVKSFPSLKGPFGGTDLRFVSTHNTFGDRSFAVAGPRVWNSLPAHLRDEDITYDGFRRELKTFCFNVASGAQ